MLSVAVFNCMLDELGGEAIVGDVPTQTNEHTRPPRPWTSAHAPESANTDQVAPDGPPPERATSRSETNQHCGTVRNQSHAVRSEISHTGSRRGARPG